MAVTISFKPFPGAPYFSAAGHRRDFKHVANHDPAADLESSIAMLKELHALPEQMSVKLLSEIQAASYLSQFAQIIVKDNPANGIDELLSEKTVKNPGAALDLSYSYPSIQAEVSNYESVIIRLQASLGLPVNAVCVFSHSSFVNEEPPSLSVEEAYVMHWVLDDISRKGNEQHVREMNYKAAVLYQLLSDCRHVEVAAPKEIRSKTMIRAKCDAGFAEKIQRFGYVLDVQHLENETFIVIANYATHSKELIELFSDRVMAL